MLVELGGGPHDDVLDVAVEVGEVGRLPGPGQHISSGQFHPRFLSGDNNSPLGLLLLPPPPEHHLHLGHLEGDDGAEHGEGDLSSSSSFTHLPPSLSPGW